MTAQKFFLSSDLLNWQQVYSPFTEYFYAQPLAYGADVWVYTYSQRAGSNSFQYIVTSSDVTGANWTVTYSEEASGFHTFLSSPVYANSNFYVTNLEDDVLLKSMDGFEWSQATLPSNCIEPTAPIEANNQLYVGCEDEVGDITYFLLSDDQWTQTTLTLLEVENNALNSMEYLSNGVYVATTDYYGRLWYSCDGINWEESNTPSSPMFENAIYMINYFDGIYLAGNFLDLWTVTENQIPCTNK